MIVAKYRGFSTFGLLLITGVFFAYFYTIVFMVALLAIIEGKENL
jgi:predicted RND superfamily exporter protein